MKQERHPQISAKTILQIIREKIQEMETRGQEMPKTRGAITDFCEEIAIILGIPSTNRSFRWRISQIYQSEAQKDSAPPPRSVVKVKKIVKQPIVIEMSQEEQGTLKAIKEVGRITKLLISNLNDTEEALRGLQSEITRFKEEIKEELAALREDVNEGAISR